MNNSQPLPNIFDLLFQKLNSIEQEIQALRQAVDEGRSSDILDRDGAAKVLGISPHTIGKWVLERRIPFTQSGPGCKLLFSKKALELWAEENRQRTVGEIENGV